MNYFFTTNLKLRRIEKKDLALIHQWHISADAHGDHLSPHDETLDQLTEQLENDVFWHEGSKTYLVELKEDLQPIGTFHYWSKPDDSTTAMYALKVAVPACRRKGYGTEMQKGMIKELFEKYKFKHIEVFTDIDNIPQQRCLEKLDFDYVGVRDYQDQGFDRQGKVYLLSRERYENSSIFLYYYDY